MIKQTVILTYFKPSGKYYSEGRFDTNHDTEYNVVADVKVMQRIGNLPGLVENGGREFSIHISYGEGKLSVPALVRPLEVHP